MLSAVLALFLAAHCVQAGTQIPVGEFVACDSSPHHVTNTPFGLGVLGLRGNSRYKVKCGAQAPAAASGAEKVGQHAGLDTPLLFKQELNGPTNVAQPAAPGLNYCQLVADAEYWNALLKVYIPAGSVPEAEVSSKKVAEYAGEPDQPVVLVFPSGDLFIPSAVLSKVTFKCSGKPLDTTSAAPVVPASPEFQQWGVKYLQHLKHRRIVSTGDFHGDMEHARRVLRMARIIDDKNNWAGGKTIYVQTGDTVDRGVDTIEIVEWLNSLIPQAEKAGGRAILLNGNHEIMNLSGDDRYISDEEKSDPARSKAIADAFNPQPKPAPSPVGRLSRILLDRPGVVQVGKSVFLHGGLHPTFAKKGITATNNEIKTTLVQYCLDARSRRLRESKYPVFGDNGPYWLRTYALDSERTACPLLNTALEYVQADRMVVGHTIQENLQVNSRCKNKLFLQDVAMSRVYGEDHVGATEIRGSTVWAMGLNGWRLMDEPVQPDTGAFTWPTVVEPAVIV